MKRYMVDVNTGPDAATEYRLRHPPRANGGLRQFMRADRIENGLRPLKYRVESKAERKTRERAYFSAR